MKYSKDFKKVDHAGNLRKLTIVVENDTTYTITGQDGGKFVQSKPKKYEAKNDGRANAKTSHEVAFAKFEKMCKDAVELRNYVPVDAAIPVKGVKFDCTLAQRYDKRKDKVTFPVIASPKLDGIRCIVDAKGMWSRANKPLNSAPHIFNAIKSTGIFDKYPNIKFDGELYNHDLKENFNKVISLAKKAKPNASELRESASILQFHCFDVFHPDTYTNRVNIYVNEVLTKQSSKSLAFVESKVLRSHEEVEAHFAKCLEAGYEGSMLRLEYDQPYEMKRTNNLLKVKVMQDAEFEIVDFLEGVGNRSGMAGNVVCKLGNRTFEAGLSGNFELFEEYLKNRMSYIGKKATIQFQNYTPDGVPRFGVMKAVRDYE